MSHEHRPDGRLRVAAILIVSLAATVIDSIDTLAVLLGVAALATAILVARGNLKFRSLYKRLAVVNFFVFWIWLTIPVDWPTLQLDDLGITLALKISLRINLIALSVSVLLMRMNGIDFARAVVGLGMPQSLGTLLALTVRSIALLDSTRSRLAQAMRARAYRTSASFRTLRVSSQLVAWLIIHALVRSERIRLGLAARGYTTMRWPTRQHSHWHSLPRSEWTLFIGVLAVILSAWIFPKLWT
jgi:cobalt/nickel transport system permease protein